MQIKTKEKTIRHFIKKFTGLSMSFLNSGHIFQHGQSGVVLHYEWIGWLGGDSNGRRFKITQDERENIINTIKSLAK